MVGLEKHIKINVFGQIAQSGHEYFLMHSHQILYLSSIYLPQTLPESKPCRSRYVWNDHQSMLIADIPKHFRVCLEFPMKDSDLLAQVLLEVRNYLSDMVTAPFSTFGFLKRVRTQPSGFQLFG